MYVNTVYIIWKAQILSDMSEWYKVLEERVREVRKAFHSNLCISHIY